MRSDSPTSGESARSGRAARVPESVLGTIEAHLRQRELRRDELHQRARRLRRLAQGTMGQIHEGHVVDRELAEIRREAAELTDWLHREGRGDEGLAHDALQESVEAILLGAIIHAEPLPGPADLAVEPEPYLMGLGDVVGEVRRLALGHLGHGDLAAAEADLDTMEHLFRTLMHFDTTRAIVSLKPKQDVARSLLEKTRGDVTMARMLHRSSAGPGRTT